MSQNSWHLSMTYEGPVPISNCTNEKHVPLNVTSRHVTSRSSHPGWSGIESKVGARVREESVSIIHRQDVTSQISWDGVVPSLSLSRCCSSCWRAICLSELPSLTSSMALSLTPPRRKEAQTKFTGSVDLWKTTLLSVNKVTSSIINSWVAADSS
jgi:hypothetical protein